MVGYSPGTNGKDVVFSTIILPRFKDSTEFVKWLPKAKGKLVLTAAPKLSCRPQPQWAARGGGNRGSASIRCRARSRPLEWWAERRASPGRPPTGYIMALGGGSLGVRLEKMAAAGRHHHLSPQAGVPSSKRSGRRRAGAVARAADAAAQVVVVARRRWRDQRLE